MDLHDKVDSSQVQLVRDTSQCKMRNRHPIATNIAGAVLLQRKNEGPADGTGRHRSIQKGAHYASPYTV